MIYFLLRRLDQGRGWVARQGSAKSYTNRIDRARRYATREAAEQDRCEGNERIVEIRP